jgi:hypothetical protein
LDKEVNKGVELKDALARFDTYFRQKKQSFCTLIQLLQTKGLLTRKLLGRNAFGESPQGRGVVGVTF